MREASLVIQKRRGAATPDVNLGGYPDGVMGRSWTVHAGGRGSGPAEAASFSGEDKAGRSAADLGDAQVQPRHASLYNWRSSRVRSRPPFGPQYVGTGPITSGKANLRLSKEAAAFSIAIVAASIFAVAWPLWGRD